MSGRTAFRWWMVPASLAGFLVAREAFLAFVPRRWNRQMQYGLARARAQELGLPLLVLGSPSGGFVNVFSPDYGCGDVCADLDGCPSCPAGATLEGPAEETLSALPDGGAVAFVSCTLEYVSDVERVWAELRRIAGTNIFVAAVEPLSLTAFFFPGAQRRLTFVPPAGSSAELQFTPLPWRNNAPRALGAG